ncbi:MAG: long-chain fatty acid--CoA ligase, partial [Sinomicrobium sp.]|nr:long-chain fatty acid--CoA ligase [Sinomicrobium sp.]
MGATASPTRIFDLVYFISEKFDVDSVLATKKAGIWVKTAPEAYIAEANTISRGLLRLGVEKDDKIAVIASSNRTEWHILDMGLLQIGAQNVPLYPTVSEQDYEYILNHSEAGYCFVSDAELLAKVNAIKANVPSLKAVYTFDEVEGAKNWNEVLDLGEDNSNQDAVEARKNSIRPDDLATVIYTSGTTGRPKGVMLSHKNIVSNVIASAKRIPLDPGEKTLSFLPVCHIFERMTIYLYHYLGLSVHFAESLDSIGDNLREVKPHMITVVPRIMEKLYDKIYAKGATLTGLKKKLFFWAVKVGSSYEPYGKNGWWYGVKLGIARKLIFSKWKAALGSNLRLAISGSAPLQPRLSRIFAAAGIPTMEGYGLTETSPVVSVNEQKNNGWKIGAVGKPIDDIEVKIAEDGEILCKGPNIMLGYYKEPERTAEAVKDGYFHTGDIGEIDKDGFLKITDRKKEIFKTSGGKYIAPQLIENELKQSRFIEQIMVIGEGEKMPAAFIQLNFE